VKVFVELRENGEIIQVADGFPEAPFENAVEVPEEFAKAVARSPEDWQFVNGAFIQLKKEKVPIERPDDEVLKLKNQVSELQQELGKKNQEIAVILLELAQLKGGTA